MYPASKKTRAINSFKRTAVVSPRDLYARYGMRINTKAIHSCGYGETSTVVPEGSSMIQQMILGQEVLKQGKTFDEDLPH